MRPNRPARNDAEHGFILVAVMFFMLILGGLSVGMIQEGMASRLSIAHHETSTRALEAAETGLVRAEMELRAQVDYGSDGIGAATGTFDGGAFDVAVTDDPVSPNRWVLRATGRYGHSVRRLEVGVRRRQGGRFLEALFSEEPLVLGGGTPTDAYDSRAGTWASQAVNTDALGTYAQSGGHVGSNQDVELNGSGVLVRGDAIPGPLHEVVLSGGATVTGDRAPRTFDVSYEPPTFDEFQAAMTGNDNNLLTGSGQGNSLRYHSSRMTLEVTGGNTVTMPAGTYFFSELTLKGNSTLNITGPVTIYVTGTIDLGAGANILASSPRDVQILAHPYPLPGGANAPTSTEIKVNSGSQVTWALLAPAANLSVNGGNHFYGAAVVNRVDISGGNFFHYDKALGQVWVDDVPRMERLYWRELGLPQR